MLRPKQRRAMLMSRSACGKLLRMLACVLSVKTRKPERAIVRHATSDAAVEMWVIWANRSVGAQAQVSRCVE